MSRPEPPSWAGGQEERLLPLVIVVPYLALAVLTAVTLAVRWGTGRSLLIDLGLCAGAALWMLFMFSRRHDSWDRPGEMVLFFAGLVVLVGVLVVRDPWFGLFTPVCYFYAFGFVAWPWWLAGVAVVALESGSAQTAGVSSDSAVGIAVVVVVLAVNVLCMCGFTWWEQDADRKNREREAALAQVREANLRLEATLDVSDDGCGFAPGADRAPAPTGPGAAAEAADAGGGFGLEAMRERIEALSGTLRVRSRSGSGTTVSARVPYRTSEVCA